MHQIECQRAIKNLIESGHDTLVSNLSYQGVQRRIDQIATTPLSPPVQFYYVLVYVSGARSFSYGRSNVNKTHEACVYDVDVHLVDAAYQQMGDNVPYGKMSDDFRLFCDRVISLLRDTDRFGAEPPYDEPCFRLLRGEGTADRVVRIENLDHNWYDNEGNLVGAILYTVLKVQVEEMWA
jgi:hypothetical protein